MAKFNLNRINGLENVQGPNNGENNEENSSENKGMVGAGLLNAASQAQAVLQKATIFVPYDKIVRNPMNKMSRKNIDELAQLIELAGLQQPLVVKQTGDGNYMILTGERRYLAIGKLISEGKWNQENLVEVKLQDMDKLNVPLQEDTKELFEVVVTNQHRKNTDSDKYFEAMSWKKIIQEFRENGKQLRVVGYDENGEPIEQMRTIMTTGMDDDGNAIEEDITGIKTQQIIGDKLGVSAAFVGQMEKIENNGSEALKDALMNEKVGISLGSKVAGLDQNEQENFLKTVLEKKDEGDTITNDDLRRYQYEKEKTSVKKKEEEPEDDLLPGKLITEKQLKADLKKITKALKANGGIRLDDAKYDSYIRQIQLLEKLFV